ncbi:MAG: chloride channel protein [Cyanobacteria bacterium K_DeepCast_35m_m2_023]|nr:chloride channel protein [Cyanobacteria bacterium K_DeepCast_35m_m2_023]
MIPSSNPLVTKLGGGIVLIAQLSLLGLLVGLACWPLNLVDHWQDLLLHGLPRFVGGGWTPSQALLICSPVVVMPLLLRLQAGPWRDGAGSGIPQTIVSLENSDQASTLMAARPVVRRLVTWSIASLALFPLGREGPVVQVGAAVAVQLRRRWPRVLERLSGIEIMATAAGAGLAGGFNSPLMGVVFVAEELTARFAPQVIWPSLVVCAIAAEVSNLGGQPLFGLGIVRLGVQEGSQVLWGLLLGVICGLAGGVFAWLLLQSTRWLAPRIRHQPLAWGLLLGGILSLLAWLSGGGSGGDGEALMGWLIQDSPDHQASLPLLLARLFGPVLALGAGIPGGLIDPAFAIGAVLGDLIGQLGGQPLIGITLGMAAGLAGATQLPAMSLVFALRMAGDQQLLPGVLMAAVIGAYAGKLWMRKPVYHALTDLMQQRA